MAGETTQDAARSQCACCKDSFSNFPGRTIVAEKHDPLLCEHSVDEYNDGVGIGTTDGQV